MRVPFPCLECGKMLLVMDVTKDHQHIECGYCGTVMCLQCVTIKVSPVWMEERARMAKAHLN